MNVDIIIKSQKIIITGNNYRPIRFRNANGPILHRIVISPMKLSVANIAVIAKPLSLPQVGKLNEFLFLRNVIGLSIPPIDDQHLLGKWRCRMPCRVSFLNINRDQIYKFRSIKIKYFTIDDRIPGAYILTKKMLLCTKRCAIIMDYNLCV